MRKVGRPLGSVRRTETVQVKVSPEELAAVDRWRSNQPTQPSRAASLRWFAMQGVQAAEQPDAA